MMSVTGTVKLDGKTVSNCKVGFFPDTETFNPDRHGFGFGITDSDGRLEIEHPQGDKGIWAGNYKVSLEKTTLRPLDAKIIGPLAATMSTRPIRAICRNT